MSPNESSQNPDKNGNDEGFKRPGPRLGTKVAVKEKFMDQSSAIEGEELKEAVEQESKDEAEEMFEDVMVDRSDISDPEPPAHPPYGAPPQAHSAGKPIKKKKVTGLRAEAKTLYKGPRICTCCENWFETPPEDAHATIKSSAEHGDHALLIRKTAHSQDRAWKIQSMMIYSPYIMDKLRIALRTIQGSLQP